MGKVTIQFKVEELLYLTTPWQLQWYLGFTSVFLAV